MNYFEKWNLTEDEWNLISMLPYHVSFSVAIADGIINPEETSPYSVFRNLMSANKEDCALVDMCNVSLDRAERNIDESSIIDDYLNKYNLLDEDGSYVRKVFVVDHFLRVLNLFDDYNKDKIKEYVFNLGLDTAYSYGVPENPLDQSEYETLEELFRWLEIDKDKYFEEKTRENFYANLNGEE